MSLVVANMGDEAKEHEAKDHPLDDRDNDEANEAKVVLPKKRVKLEHIPFDGSSPAAWKQWKYRYTSMLDDFGLAGYLKSKAGHGAANVNAIKTVFANLLKCLPNSLLPLFQFLPKFEYDMEDGTHAILMCQHPCDVWHALETKFEVRTNVHGRDLERKFTNLKLKN
jgi:hypothetical protein